MRSTWQLTLSLLVTALFLRAQDELPIGAPSTNPSHCDSILKHEPAAPRVSGGRLVHRVAPKYPKAARRAHVQGSVRLSATIAKDGSVKDVVILDGDPTLAAAAVDAVGRWRYEPYILNDEPAEVPTEITLNFNLDGSVGPSQNSNLPKPLAAADAAATTPEVANSGLPYTIYELGSDITPPKRTFAPDPTYPESARKAKTQGNVVLGVVVTPEGNVANIEVCRSLDAALDQKAFEAVSRWKFEPATKEGEPVAVHVRIDITFRLY
jgi:TonB family protein